MAHAHFKEVCIGCEKVISQCRCMDANKPVRRGVCHECIEKGITLQEGEKVPYDHNSHKEAMAILSNPMEQKSVLRYKESLNGPALTEYVNKKGIKPHHIVNLTTISTVDGVLHSLYYWSWE